MSSPRNLALTIEYDGTGFHGWQIQNGYRTVEGELQKALQAVTHAPVKLFAASRTDAGVHARGQAAHFLSDCAFPLARIQGALAQILPEDIAVLDIEEKPESFHARHDAKGKWYRYSVLQREMPPTIDRVCTMHMKDKLRMSAMEKAAKLLTGTHDFSSFGVNSGTEPENPVKTIYHLSIKSEAHKFYFDIVGDSFLYRMVRSMVGTLLDIGQGKKDAHTISDIIEKKNRCAAGPTVPSHGLCLMKVFYDDSCKSFSPS